jgi:hypothetical protein
MIKTSHGNGPGGWLTLIEEEEANCLWYSVGEDNHEAGLRIWSWITNQNGDSSLLMPLNWTFVY